VFPHVTACTLALSPYFVTCFTEGFNHVVTSIVAPAASGWSGCRVRLAPTGKAPPLHGARQLLPFGNLAVSSYSVYFHRALSQDGQDGRNFHFAVTHHMSVKPSCCNASSGMTQVSAR
jgi:hypothetical protein